MIRRTRLTSIAVILLGTTGCVAADSASTNRAPSVDEIESSIEALDADWASEPRVPVTHVVFAQMCSEVDDVVGFVEGSVVEVRNEAEAVGFRQSVATFETPSVARDYVELWRGSPLACMQIGTFERTLEVEGADEVLRLDLAFPDSTSFAQQLAIIRYRDVVVLVGMSLEAETTIDLDDLIRLVAGSTR